MLSAMIDDAIVVGGGLRGRVAARGLRQPAARVRLLEARERFGGRAWTAPFGPGDCRLVELGGGWFDTRLQRPLRDEVDRYGVRVVPAPSFGSARWHTGGELRAGFPVPPGRRRGPRARDRRDQRSGPRVDPATAART